MEKNSLGSIITFCLLGLIVIAIGNYTLNQAAEDRKDYEEIKGWSKTSGNITYSINDPYITYETEEYCDTDDNCDEYVETYTRDNVTIMYEYQVNNVYYISSTVSNCPWSKKTSLVGKYQPGSVVEVIYDPTNPSSSYLEITESCINASESFGKFIKGTGWVFVILGLLGGVNNIWVKYK